MSSTPNPTSFRLPTALTVPNDIEHKGEKIPIPTQIRDNIRMLFSGLLDAHQAIVSLSSRPAAAAPAPNVVNNITNVSAASPQTGTFFIGPGHLTLPPQQTQTEVVLVNNEVRAWMFTIPFQITIGHISLWFNAFVGFPFVGVGLYDLSGNALVTTTFSPTAVTFYTNSVGPVTLAAGAYYLAQSSSDNQTFCFGDNNLRPEMQSVMNAVSTKIGVAANVLSGGGAMPATLGVITPTTYTSTLIPPIAALFEV